MLAASSGASTTLIKIIGPSYPRTVSSSEDLGMELMQVCGRRGNGSLRQLTCQDKSWLSHLPLLQPLSIPGHIFSKNPSPSGDHQTKLLMGTGISGYFYAHKGILLGLQLPVGTASPSHLSSSCDLPNSAGTRFTMPQQTSPIFRSFLIK